MTETTETRTNADLFNEIMSALDQNPDGYPETWRPEVGDTIVGRYISSEEEVGKFRQTVYTLEDLDTGVRRSVFGNVVLNDRMSDAEYGDIVGIRYMGKKKNYHVYNVIIRPGTTEE